MILRIENVLDRLMDLLIRGNVLAREIFFPDIHIVAHDRRLEDLTQPLEARDRELNIRGSSQPVRIDERRVVHASTADGDVAARSVRVEGCEEGCVLVTVRRRTGAGGGEVADVGGEG